MKRMSVGVLLLCLAACGPNETDYAREAREAAAPAPASSSSSGVKLSGYSRVGVSTGN